MHAHSDGYLEPHDPPITSSILGSLAALGNISLYIFSRS
jgi:hypothetical protein